LNPKPLSLKLHVTVTDFSKSLSTAAIAGNGACVTLGHSAFVTASDLSVLAAFAICIKSVTGAGITCTCPAARPACRCCMMCRNCKTTAAHEGRLSTETIGAGRELYDAIRTRAAHSTDRQIECVPSNHSTQHVASHSAASRQHLHQARHQSWNNVYMPCCSSLQTTAHNMLPHTPGSFTPAPRVT